MSTKDEQTRRAHVAELPDKELFRLLYLFEEMRDVAAIIWPGDLLADQSMDDIQAMLKDEMGRRTAGKGTS